MAFDIVEALGLNKVVSILDTGEIRQIPVELLDENTNNFFSVADVQDLKDSIAVNGILQPLLVVPDNGRYRLIAGHRRRKAAMELAAEGNSRFAAVPCVILPEMSEAMEETTLIQTNTTARELSYSEKMEAVKRLKKTLVQLKQEGVKLPGKLRDIVAEQLEISRTEVARMEVIDKRLTASWRQKLDAGNISASCAYELARLSDEDQSELFADLVAGKYTYMVLAIVQDYAVRKTCRDWMVKDCPLSTDGYWASEQRKKGLPIPCREYKKILDRKNKGHPERCPGCCFECADRLACKFCCNEVKDNDAKIAASQARSSADAMERSAFDSSCLRVAPARIAHAMSELSIDQTELERLFKAQYSKFAPSVSPRYYRFGEACTATKARDLPAFLVSMAAFCQAIDTNPSYLLGINDQCGGWERMSDKAPPDGSRVIVRRCINGSIFVGEYLYRSGKWYNPDLDEFEMNVTGVQHWILPPG